MRYLPIIFLSTALPATIPASVPSITAGYCKLLERALSGPQAQTQQNNVGLDLVKRIALGSDGSVVADLESQLGLKPGQLKGLSLKTPEARACAFRVIGETGQPEAERFLQGLKQADFESDKTQQIWPTAQIALKDARLRQITDPQSQIDYLENTLTAMTDGRGAVADWVVNQLCDRGALTSLAIIQKSIRSRLNGQRDEDEVRFCETRIQVIRRNPDRVKALGSVLTVDRGEEDRLKLWAIYQLDSLRSPLADAELDRFASEIAKVPPQSPARQRLAASEAALRDVMNGRTARHTR
jgi:hypothetical protein